MSATATAGNGGSHMTETDTTMTIGGALPRNLIEALSDRIEQEFSERTDDNQDIVAVAEAGDQLVIQGTTRYGDATAVVAFCVDHGLAYHLCWENSPGADAGVQYWR